jgi:DNA-binding response OmpR family regulator
MKSVLIVDGDATSLSTDLNAIAERQKLDLEFRPCLTPEQMFAELSQRTPDLIVLHHNWPGLSISQLLERIAAGGQQTRVIVFTGQALKVSELIECVRSGVADYWMKGSVNAEFMLRRISYYCASPAWTMEKLRMPSGSLRLLLEQAERSIQEISALSEVTDDLQVRLLAAEGKERAAFRMEVVGVVKFIINVAVLTCGFIAIRKCTNVETWAALIFVSIVAVFLLFLEGKLSDALVQWTGGTIKVRGANPTDDKGPGDRAEHGRQ